MKVDYVYLKEEFHPDKALAKDILRDIREFLRKSCMFTLGEPVREFEEAFAAFCGVKHAVGVGSGTDALFLIMKALGVGPGREVVTVPNTFVATVNAIVACGARPLFVDVGGDYLMDIAKAHNHWKDVIIPVHLTGRPCFFPYRHPYGRPYGCIIEDAAQAIGAEVAGKKVGSLGTAAAFSFHPLKNVKVWGDGGVVTTDDDALADEVKLLRNHGLRDRDTCIRPGYNSRLDSIQAIVALHELKRLDWVTEKRIENARFYDANLRGIAGVTLPPRDPQIKEVFHLYVIQADRRDQLMAYLARQGIESKIHYPVAIHLQPAYAFLGHKAGDFPVCEAQAKRILSLPIHEYLKREQLEYVVDAIAKFVRPGLPEPRVVCSTERFP